MSALNALNIARPRAGKATHTEVPIILVHGSPEGFTPVSVTNDVGIAHAWLKDMSPDRGISLPPELNPVSILILMHWIADGEIR